MSDLQNKINLYIKNKVDISDIIRDKNINGLNLSGSIIKNINFDNKTILDVDFSNCVIGEYGTNISWANAVFQGCSFRRSVFLSNTNMDNTKMYNCNFLEADVSRVSYKYAETRDCLWCDCIIKMSSDNSKGSKWDDSFFNELEKMYNIKITKGE